MRNKMLPLFLVFVGLQSTSCEIVNGPLFYNGPSRRAQLVDVPSFSRNSNDKQKETLYPESVLAADITRILADSELKAINEEEVNAKDDPFESLLHLGVNMVDRGRRIHDFMDLPRNGKFLLSLDSEDDKAKLEVERNIVEKQMEPLQNSEGKVANVVKEKDSQIIAQSEKASIIEDKNSEPIVAEVVDSHIQNFKDDSSQAFANLEPKPIDTFVVNDKEVHIVEVKNIRVEPIKPEEIIQEPIQETIQVPIQADNPPPATNEETPKSGGDSGNDLTGDREMVRELEIIISLLILCVILLAILIYAIVFSFLIEICFSCFSKIVNKDMAKSKCTNCEPREAKR